MSASKVPTTPLEAVFSFLSKGVVETKRVRYLGDATVDLPTLGVAVDKGDEIDVPDDFVNARFEEVVAVKQRTTAKEDV